MISTLCKDIHKLFLAGTKETDRELFDKAHELSRYFMVNQVTTKSIKPVLELERKLIVGKGPNKHHLEEQVLKALIDIADYCAEQDSHKQRLPLTPALLEKPAGNHEKARHALALELEGLPRRCFN